MNYLSWFNVVFKLYTLLMVMSCLRYLQCWLGTLHELFKLFAVFKLNFTVTVVNRLSYLQCCTFKMPVFAVLYHILMTCFSRLQWSFLLSWVVFFYFTVMTNLCCLSVVIYCNDLIQLSTVLCLTVMGYLCCLITVPYW